jgi:hypothetical protein
MIDVLDATDEHAYYLGENMRVMDVHKCECITGTNATKALFSSLRHSNKAFTAIKDGKPIAMFGVVGSALCEVGIPWLLCTDEALKTPITFARMSRKWMPILARGYKRLENYVDDENEKAKRWLEWMGFTLGEPEPYGAMQKLHRCYVYEEVL